MTNNKKWNIPQSWQDIYIQTIQECLISKEAFDVFRTNPNYTTIIGDAMPAEQAQLLFNELIKNKYVMSKLDIIKQMDKIGLPNTNHLLSTSPRNLRYMYTASLIHQYFGEVSNIVEIGIGYGGLCFTMGNIFGLTGYKLIDIDCVVELARLFLSKLPPIYNVQSEKDFFNPDPPYNITISECGLSELNDDLIQYYYKKYLLKSKYIFLRVNFSNQSRSYNTDDFCSMLQKDFLIKRLPCCPNYSTDNKEKETILGYNTNMPQDHKWITQK